MFLSTKNNIKMFREIFQSFLFIPMVDFKFYLLLLENVIFQKVDVFVHYLLTEKKLNRMNF